jgi:hypothetical protein
MFGQVDSENILKAISKLKLNPNLEDFIIGGSFQVLGPHSNLPFAWFNRTMPKRLLGIKLGTSIQEIDLEKALEVTEIKSADGNHRYTIEVRVSGNSK